jgi:uncharacterized protein YciI
MPPVPFQRLTVVRFVNAKNQPPDGPDDGAIQAAHVRYMRELTEKNIILANGPFKRIDDTEIRGMGLWLVSPEEARRLVLEDAAVKAGWFEVKVDEWIFPAEPKTIGNRHDLELDVPL